MSRIYETLKKALIRQEPDETLLWDNANLTNAEIRQDFDFIAFSGRTEHLLADSTVRGFIESQNGRIMKRAREALCRSSLFSHVLHFCTIGDYMVGITLFNSNVSQIGLANRANKQFYRNLVERNSSNFINSSLIPFRDIQNFLLTHYSESYLTIFRYGQKTDFVAEDLNTLLSAVSTSIHVDIAIALEIDREGYFMLPNSFYFAGAEIFPFLGSTQAGPLYVKNPQNVFLDAYHICIYNTIQHVRKHTDYHLSTSSQNFNLVESLRNSISRVTADSITLYNNIEQNKKLRLEVYISFSPDYDICNLLRHMKDLLYSDNVILATSCTDVKNQANYQCTLIQNLALHSPLDTFTDLFILCSLYTQLIRNLFCTEKLTSDFQNGFYLQASLFNSAQDVCFTPEPILQIPKYFSNHKELQLYTRIKQIESFLHIPMSYLKLLMHKVAFEIESFYEQFYQKYNCMAGETVSLEEFLKKQKSVSNSVHSSIATALLNFYGRDLFTSLTERIAKHGLSLKIHGRIYLYHAGSANTSAAAVELVDPAAFRLQLLSFYQHSQRAGIREFVGPLDFPDEYLERLLRTLIPERCLISEFDSCPFVLLHKIFKTTNGFLRFGIYFFICVKLGEVQNIPKVLSNYKQSIRDNVKDKLYNASQLLIYTGCFVPEGYAKQFLSIQKVPIARISRILKLPPNKFLPILKATREESTLVCGEALNHAEILGIIANHSQENQAALNSGDEVQAVEGNITHDVAQGSDDESSGFSQPEIEESFPETEKTFEDGADFMVLFNSELLQTYRERFSSLFLTVKDIREAPESEIISMCHEASGLSTLLCKSIARELREAALH